VGEAQQGDFFNQARNLPPRGIESGSWRCYSEVLTLTLEASLVPLILDFCDYEILNGNCF
jgi:hypothetical protein